MQIAVLGTGVVGRTLATGFDEKGHDVTIGTRDVETLLARTETDRMGSPPFASWIAEHADIELGTFAQAAADAEIVVNATLGTGSIEALESAGPPDGAIVIDTANPLDFSGGSPALFVQGSDSLAERIGRALPTTRVVKAWSTMSASVMTDPGAIGGGDHTIPICGDDPAAKAAVTELLRSFGWRDVLDLGDLTNARGMEAYVLLWLSMFKAAGTTTFNTKLVR